MKFLNSIFPATATVFFGDKTTIGFSAPVGERRQDGTVLTLTESKGELDICISSMMPLRCLKLRWNLATPFPEDAKFSGDTWSRCTGQSRWDSIDPNRDFPWFLLMNGGKENFGIGVKTGGSAFANFMVDPLGISLFFDLRCGCAPSESNGRTIHAGTVVALENREKSAFQNACDLLDLLKPDQALLPAGPVCGFNNWYYAYGKSSHVEILQDTDYLMSLCDGLGFKPYMVIDDGWQPNKCSGPWTCGNERFPDMAKLADEISSRGAIPGLWFRPLKTEDVDIQRRFGLKHVFNYQLDPSPDPVLDPSYPEVLEMVKDDIRRFGKWGYRLVKHDFSTIDSFAEFDCHIYRFPGIHPNAWSFHDKTKTSAEILTGLYRAIAGAAAEYDIAIIGCNVIGHLAAGLNQIARTGDDTSGRDWDPNRKHGVNALAFRMPHHNRLYAADADCAGMTATNTPPWPLVKQWMSLLANSGTPLFLSIKPGILTPEQFKFVREQIKAAVSRHTLAEPLDWLNNRTPEKWLIDGQKTKFNWYEPDGNTPDFLC